MLDFIMQVNDFRIKLVLTDFGNLGRIYLFVQIMKEYCLKAS